MSKASPPLRWAAPVAAVLLLACIASGQAQPRRGRIRILARYAVSGAPSLPTDVRWASDSSVFLSRFQGGVAELKLAEGLPELRRVLLSVDVLGEKPRRIDNRYFEILGVSDGNVMVASTHPYRAWTSIERNKDGTRSVSRWNGGMTTDLDLHGRQFVLLGESGTLEKPWEDGAIAWLGSLDKGPQELKPVLYGSDRPSVRNFENCAAYLAIGAVRFLADGSFLVVPGGDPGAHLYDSRGALVRSWDAASLGLDPAGCSGMAQKESDELSAYTDKLFAWVNAHRVLDEILPLPQGPGLLLRWRGADGLVHWELKVLGPGRVATYAIPFTSDRPFDRLHGDVRNGRIVLLRGAHVWSLPNRQQEIPAELIVAEVSR